MFVKRSLATAFLAFVPAAYGQPAPSFDVASVKVSQLARNGGEGSSRESVEISPGSLSMSNVTLRSCVRWAYGVDDFQVAAPNWFASERYDVIAKASGTATKDQLRLMLRGLLAERFKLVLHHETKELPVYALLVGSRGSKLKTGNTDAPSSMRPNGGALEFRNMSMAELAERLPARPFGIDRPVIDRTGLPGAFDFTMKLANNDAELKSSLERGESERDSSLFTVPLQQLGLKLKPQKGPIDMLVIDDAEKIPIKN
jgi:uncharacterized protein (TIGR03435 family)